MSATYLVDMSDTFVREIQLADKEQHPLRKMRGEWQLVEKVANLPEYLGEGQGYTQRWRVYDSEADSALEGRLVQPAITQDFDEATGIFTYWVSDRIVMD